MAEGGGEAGKGMLTPRPSEDGLGGRYHSEPPITNGEQAPPWSGTAAQKKARQPENESRGRAGGAWRACGREGVARACAGQGTPPAAQGARRAPGLFRSGAAWRGGRGCRAGILSGGGDARRALPRGGLESAARPPATSSPAGATATRAERPGSDHRRHGPRPG